MAQTLLSVLAQDAVAEPLTDPLPNCIATATDGTAAASSSARGLVASSKAQRLKPHAIEIRVDVDPVHWFPNGKDDTRSSYYLQDAATEFQIRGLELEWFGLRAGD
jgi:hypothetical protein